MTDKRTHTDEDAAPSLKEVSAHIETLLKQEKPSVVVGVPEELHPLPPFIPKYEWTRLGDALKVAESPTVDKIPGEKWISLRCDGTGFSKLTKRLFGKGYSDEFASIMQACALKLMDKFIGKFAYTHSDELTVLIPPTSVVRGERQVHMYNGRVMKLCSLAASNVTSTFVSMLTAKLSRTDGIDKGVETALQFNPSFDCRVGMYDTRSEALSLILWRSYDCGVNSAQDAVHKSGVSGSKNIEKLGTDSKLVWLKDNDLLPLKPHQRDGTYWTKRKIRQCGRNQKTGEAVKFLRSRAEQIEGNVLISFKAGALVPADDTLEE